MIMASNSKSEYVFWEEFTQPFKGREIANGYYLLDYYLQLDSDILGYRRMLSKKLKKFMGLIFITQGLNVS